MKPVTKPQNFNSLSKDRKTDKRNCLEIKSTMSAKHVSRYIHYPINNLVLIKPIIILPFLKINFLVQHEIDYSIVPNQQMNSIITVLL